MNERVSKIAEKVLTGGQASEADARALAEPSGPDIYDLMYWANRIREHFCGDGVHLCSVVNARSGGCREDCRFCAQSAHNRTEVDTRPMMPAADIVKASQDAASSEASNFGIVTSGPTPGPDEDFHIICQAAKKLLSRGGPTACVSLGRLTSDQTEALKTAGVRRIHHNLETSRRFFPNVCTTHSYDDRVETVRAIKAAGMQVCSGGIFGLGETWQDRIDMALELRELDVDSVPLNFLSPVPGTPFEDNTPLPPMDCLKIISLYRFILPRKQIKTAGGREDNLRDMQSWMYYAGASGTLIGNYLTTAGRAPEADLRLLAELGLKAAGA